MIIDRVHESSHGLFLLPCATCPINKQHAVTDSLLFQNFPRLRTVCRPAWIDRSTGRTRARVPSQRQCLAPIKSRRDSTSLRAMRGEAWPAGHGHCTFFGSLSCSREYSHPYMYSTYPIATVVRCTGTGSGSVVVHVVLRVYAYRTYLLAPCILRCRNTYFLGRVRDT